MSFASVDKEILKANLRLKGTGSAKIYRKNSKLYIQAKLPPKPDSHKTESHWQYLATSESATMFAVKTVEIQARELNHQLESGKFSWQDWYTQRKAKQGTVGYWIEEFGKNYLGRNPDSAKLNTYKKNYEAFFLRMGVENILTSELMRKTVKKCSEGNSRSRQLFVMSYNSLARFAGIEVNLVDLRSTYTRSSVNDREIPSDQNIISAWQSIEEPEWKYIFALMATYGLRNHEVWVANRSRLVEKNNPIDIPKKTKTGIRVVYPCPSKWVYEFDLFEFPGFPIIERFEELNNNDRGEKVTKKFKSLNLGFTPYALRHAYAMRLAILGIPDSIAANWMGHSVTVHHQQYHRFWDEKQSDKAMELMKDLEERRNY